MSEKKEHVDLDETSIFDATDDATTDDATDDEMHEEEPRQTARRRIEYAVASIEDEELNRKAAFNAGLRVFKRVDSIEHAEMMLQQEFRDITGNPNALLLVEKDTYNWVTFGKSYGSEDDWTYKFIVHFNSSYEARRSPRVEWYDLIKWYEHKFDKTLNLCNDDSGVLEFRGPDIVEITLSHTVESVRFIATVCCRIPSRVIEHFKSAGILEPAKVSVYRPGEDDWNLVCNVPSDD
jgi:hypothetical protein